MKSSKKDGPKPKRLRLSTLAKTEEHHENATIKQHQHQHSHSPSIEDFPQDVMTHIISYHQSDEPCEREIATLFNKASLSRVSKYCRESCYRYVQNTSTGMRITEYARISPHHYQMIAWMAQHQIKIKEIVRCKYANDLSLALLVHMLSWCNLSSLEHLVINFPHEEIQRAADWEKSIAIRAGIPQKLVEFCGSGTSVKDVQALILDLIRDKAKSLSSLMFHVVFEDFNWDFITSFSGQLRRVCLHFQKSSFPSGSETETDLQSSEKKCRETKLIIDAIASMPNLKYFNICGEMEAPISSSSLEGLAVFGGFRLLECNCPSLKRLSLVVDLCHVSERFLLSSSRSLLAVEKLILSIEGSDVDNANINALFNNGNGNETILQNYNGINRMIECMPSLIKLEIYDTCLPIKIRSNSLQTIDISKCTYNDNCHIVECVCPRLKKLKCDELQIVPVDGEEEEKFAQRTGRRMRRFPAKDFRFEGVEVPGSCVIHTCM